MAEKALMKVTQHSTVQSVQISEKLLGAWRMYNDGNICCVRKNVLDEIVIKIYNVEDPLERRSRSVVSARVEHIDATLDQVKHRVDYALKRSGYILYA